MGRRSDSFKPSALALELQKVQKALLPGRDFGEVNHRVGGDEDGSVSDFGNNVMIVKFDVCTGAGILHPNPPCLLPSSSAFAIALNSERH